MTNYLIFALIVGGVFVVLLSVRSFIKLGQGDYFTKICSKCGEKHKGKHSYCWKCGGILMYETYGFDTGYEITFMSLIIGLLLGSLIFLFSVLT